MNIAEVIRHLESIAPLHLQEDYDNAGLIVGHEDMAVSGVLVCLDSTPEVVAEAKKKGCNLIVAHHPIVFRGLKKINGKNYIEKAIIEAIKSDIAIYATHTNLDNVLEKGVNQQIARKIGLVDIEILRPKASENNPAIGAGVVGGLIAPLSEKDFLAHLKQSMALNVVKHTALTGNLVTKVAICGGSGSFLLKDAIAADAQFFITSDFKYHEFFDANGELVIADIGHFESERYTIDLIANILSEKFSNFATHYTEVITNPVNYYY